ncbi:uncharacterized protein LOC141695129 [Apium graveolens]|uniref:uncharacterized protein LOC141695129 n=1 Tax=Apium graveolens TaxID=4045 RepID=UPI003D795103
MQPNVGLIQRTNHMKVLEHFLIKLMSLDALATERNNMDAVELILLEDPAYEHGRGSNKHTLMGLIYKAIDMEYSKDIVKLLSQAYEAGINPDHKGVLNLILAIKRRDRAGILGLLQGNNQLVNFADDQGWTPLHYAAYHEFDSILDVIIDAQNNVGHQFVYGDMVSTPLHVAFKCGYTSTLTRLVQLWPVSSSAYTCINKDGQNILHLAAVENKKEMIHGILKYCPEQYKDKLLSQQDSNGNTPLHLLISNGCFIQELIRHKGLDTRVKNKKNWSPQDMLYFQDNIVGDQAIIKIALGDVQSNQDMLESLVLPSKRKAKDVEFNKYAKLLAAEEQERMKQDLERYKRTHTVAHWFPDAMAGDASAKAALEMEADILNDEGKTILHVESMRGDTERVRFILREFPKKNLLVKRDGLKRTALHLAADYGHPQVVEVLIDAARRNLPSSSANNQTNCFLSFIGQATDQMGNTALHLAVLNGNVAIVKLLIEADPNDSLHVQNNEGKTPIYIAAEKGYKVIIKEMCRTCTALSLDGPGGSTTALHAAIVNIHQEEEEEDNVIRMMINAAKRCSPEGSSFEALFRTTNQSGSTILKLAVYRNYVQVVAQILLEDPAYQHGRWGSKNNDFMHLIYTAIDRKYEDILKLLKETYEAEISVDHKGVIDLIVAIRRRHRVSVIRLLEGNKKLVTFTDMDGWTVLHHAAYHQFDSILDAIIEAQIDVGHPFVYKHKDLSTPFHVAAKEGYTFTVIRLMELWPTWSSAYTLVNTDDQNILHLAASQSKKEMIQGILKCCSEKHKKRILNDQDKNGDTPLHLLIMRGCFVPEFIKYKGLDTMIRNNKDETPLDYFYVADEIVGDQVQIKIALENIQTDEYWKFWPTSNKRKSNYLESVVLPSRREAKDVQFEIAKKKLRDEKHGRMKIDLERYKKRTSTQIVVTALITTVTFTVGFTMPGGLRQSGEIDQGLVVLSKKTAFNAFMVSDAIALLLSTCSLFLYFLESMYDDPHQVSKLNAASTGLNIVSVMAMMLTFITGTFVVLSHSLALAITVSIIGSFFFVFVIVLMIKMVYDRQVKRNED